MSCLDDLFEIRRGSEKGNPARGSRKERSKYRLALTEEKSGFDATSLETRAEKTSNGYRISGSKRFVNNVDNVDYLIVFARTKSVVESGKKSSGVSMFLVPAKDIGHQIEKTR